MSKALTLWWWKSRNNFGDILNPNVVSYVSGRKVVWRPRDKAEMIAIGSNMSNIRDRIVASDNPLYVWGSGVMRPLSRDFVNRCAFSLVRGPITSCLIGIDDLPFGDPGLLIAEALDFTTSSKKRYKYGVVPHWTHFEMPELRELVDALPNATLINPMTDDVAQTLTEIADCDVILASSLHGLIIADALEIPNIWLDTGEINQFTRLKFLDYGLSVGREFDRPISMEEAFQMTGKDEINTDYFGNLEGVKTAIKTSFPEELRA